VRLRADFPILRAVCNSAGGTNGQIALPILGRQLVSDEASVHLAPLYIVVQDLNVMSRGINISLNALKLLVFDYVIPHLERPRPVLWNDCRLIWHR
jgi:hypothetical protein